MLRLSLLLSGLFLLGTSAAFAKDGDIEVSGPITAINSSAVTVGGITCAITSGTEYEDSNSNPISRSNFSVGTQARLRCRGSDAKNLALLSGSGSSSSSSSSSSKSSSSSSKSSSSSSASSSTSSARSGLTAADGVETSARGTVRATSIRIGRKRDLRFISTVKLPVPSTIPAASSIDEAAQLALTIELSRQGSAYARCSYEVDDSSTEAGSLSAEYKVDIRTNKKSQVRAKRGTCDIDLTTDGEQTGTPAAKRGDTVSIIDSGFGQFLAGALKRF